MTSLTILDLTTITSSNNRLSQLPKHHTCLFTMGKSDFRNCLRHRNDSLIYQRSQPLQMKTRSYSMSPRCRMSSPRDDL